MTVLVATRASARLGSTLTVHEGTATGATVQQGLLGGLHPFGGFDDNPSPALAKAQAAGVIRISRRDKFLNATPIKAGAPDGTHPTLGHSGAYSYDWQIVDRDLVDAASQGAELYISLDACPQILGGSSAPYTGTNLTTKLSSSASYPPEIPNDLNAFAAMCVDLIHYITVTKGVSVPYWGLWNEPDGGQYFSGTAAQYFALYAVVANAIKAFNPALKVGGPELVHPETNFTAWVQGMLTYCKANAVALDFIAIHDYTVWGWQHHSFFAKLNRAITATAWTTPLEVIVGEWNTCHGANAPQAVSPFGAGSGVDLSVNDQAAAFCAITLMEMQRLGVVRGIYLRNDSIPTSPFSTGLFSNEAPWATGNVYRLWARIGAANVIASELAGDPGLHAMAATRAGTLYVLLANHHYRRDGSYLVTVSLPGVANGRTAVARTVDATHANQYDAGLANAEMQAAPVIVASGQTKIRLQGRSVCLLEIAP